MILRIFIFLLISICANADPVTVISLEAQGTHDGNPGATIYSAKFSDGMIINVAVYGGSHNTPVGIVGGYMGSMGYLHPFAKKFLQRGIPTFVVQPPGQGEDQKVYSGNPHKSDGYDYTIEAMGAKYLEPLCAALKRELFGDQKITLMGHSRAGYMIRFLGTGLTYVGEKDGRPLLSRDKANFERNSKTFNALISLLSPLDASPDLVWGAQVLPSQLDTFIALEERGKRAKHDLRAVEDFFSIGLDLLTLGGTWMARRSRDAYYDTVVEPALVELSTKMFVEYVIGTMPVQWDMLRMARMSMTLPSDEVIQRGLDLNRAMLGKDPNIRRLVNREELEHAVKHWGRNLPPQAAQDELRRITSDALWSTIGVNGNGKPVNFMRAGFAGRKNEENVPLHFIHANDDDVIRDGRKSDAHEKEVALDPRSRGLRVEGGHGGALYNPIAANDIVDFVIRCSDALDPKN